MRHAAILFKPKHPPHKQARSLCCMPIAIYLLQSTYAVQPTSYCCVLSGKANRLNAVQV